MPDFFVSLSSPPPPFFFNKLYQHLPLCLWSSTSWAAFTKHFPGEGMCLWGLSSASPSCLDCPSCSPTRGQNHFFTHLVRWNLKYHLIRASQREVITQIQMKSLRKFEAGSLVCFNYRLQWYLLKAITFQPFPHTQAVPAELQEGSQLSKIFKK